MYHTTQLQVDGEKVQTIYAFRVRNFGRDSTTEEGRFSLYSNPAASQCVLGNHCPGSDVCVSYLEVCAVVDQI